jgi:predicted nucleic acid-binding protein
MARPGRSSRHRRIREAAPSGYAIDGAPSHLAGILLDSDVVIEVLRGRSTVVERMLAIERQGIPTFCSPVAWAEIFAGLRPGEEAATEAFFQARGEIQIDAGVGRRAGRYLAKYAKSHAVEIADALVAAAAGATGLLLWTLNRKHYPMDDVRFYGPAGE